MNERTEGAVPFDCCRDKVRSQSGTQSNPFRWFMNNLVQSSKQWACEGSGWCRGIRSFYEVVKAMHSWWTRTGDLENSAKRKSFGEACFIFYSVFGRCLLFCLQTVLIILTEFLHRWLTYLLNGLGIFHWNSCYWSNYCRQWDVVCLYL